MLVAEEGQDRSGSSSAQSLGERANTAVMDHSAAPRKKQSVGRDGSRKHVPPKPVDGVGLRANHDGATTDIAASGPNPAVEVAAHRLHARTQSDRERWIAVNPHERLF